jgi:hypothetical protein
MFFFGRFWATEEEFWWAFFNAYCEPDYEKEEEAMNPQFLPL